MSFDFLRFLRILFREFLALLYDLLCRVEVIHVEGIVESIPAEGTVASVVPNCQFQPLDEIYWLFRTKSLIIESLELTNGGFFFFEDKFPINRVDKIANFDCRSFCALIFAKLSSMQ